MAIPLFKVFMSEDVIKPLNKVLMSGYITQGKQVDKYELELSNFLQTKYVSSVSELRASPSPPNSMLLVRGFPFFGRRGFWVAPSWSEGIGRNSLAETTARPHTQH